MLLSGLGWKRKRDRVGETLLLAVDIETVLRDSSGSVVIADSINVTPRFGGELILDFDEML